MKPSLGDSTPVAIIFRVITASKSTMMEGRERASSRSSSRRCPVSTRSISRPPCGVCGYAVNLSASSKVSLISHSPSCCVTDALRLLRTAGFQVASVLHIGAPAAKAFLRGVTTGPGAAAVLGAAPGGGCYGSVRLSSVLATGEQVEADVQATGTVGRQALVAAEGVADAEPQFVDEARLHFGAEAVADRVSPGLPQCVAAEAEAEQQAGVTATEVADGEQ